MKMNRLVSLFVLGAALMLLQAAVPPAISAADMAGAGETTGSTPADGIVAIYFHGEFRCSSCRRLEELSRKSIETGFGDELKSGLLRFDIINMETPATEHFVEDFQLVTKSLVLVEYKNGKVIRWKNLPDIWKLLRDDKAFSDYVQRETTAFLGEK